MAMFWLRLYLAKVSLGLGLSISQFVKKPAFQRSACLFHVSFQHTDDINIRMYVVEESVAAAQLGMLSQPWNAAVT